jgi:threonine/homoserine/homoserine lactone efflux protein
MPLISTFILGFFLSFLGQLPLGTMSITATQIAVQENFRNAWKYALGVALMEMVYLRLVLSGLHWIVQHKLFFSFLNWATLLFFLVLGIWSFWDARKQDAGKKALLLNNRIGRFWLGISMSALNPAQIPFWFIWSAYFLDAGWLLPGLDSFNFFTLGCGLGTVAGLVAYMYGGNFLVTRMKASNRTLNKIMGIVFVAAALAQLYRLLKL